MKLGRLAFREQYGIDPGQPGLAENIVQRVLGASTAAERTNWLEALWPPERFADLFAPDLSNTDALQALPPVRLAQGERPVEALLWAAAFYVGNETDPRAVTEAAVAQAVQWLLDVEVLFPVRYYASAADARRAMHCANMSKARYVQTELNQRHRTSSESGWVQQLAKAAYWLRPILSCPARSQRVRDWQLPDDSFLSSAPSAAAVAVHDNEDDANNDNYAGVASY